MNNTSFVRKKVGVVNQDTNALNAAKARRAHAARLDSIEKKIDLIQAQINQMMQSLNKETFDE